jgi:hypothetical protein
MVVLRIDFRFFYDDGINFLVNDERTTAAVHQYVKRIVLVHCPDDTAPFNTVKEQWFTPNQ